MGLKGSKTEKNLKGAYLREAQLNYRCLYFDTKADIEGQNDIAASFRWSAESKIRQSHGSLKFLGNGCAANSTGLLISSSRQNLMAAVCGETHEFTQIYPAMTQQARDEVSARSAPDLRPLRGSINRAPGASRPRWRHCLAAHPLHIFGAHELARMIGRA